MKVITQIKILSLPNKNKTKKNYKEPNENFTNDGLFRNEFVGPFGYPTHTNKYLVDIPRRLLKYL
jgi:hypothetical protein